MEKFVYIVANSQEYLCNKDYITSISPIVNEYFKTHPKENSFVCTIESFRGNESIFKDFLNGKEILITYNLIPFIKSLSSVFGLKSFDAQIKNIEKFIYDFDPKTSFKKYEYFSELVFDESYEIIMKEITLENYEFIARVFLSFVAINPTKISKILDIVNEIEEKEKIPISNEITRLTETNLAEKLFQNILPNFHPKIFRFHFDKEFLGKETKIEKDEQTMYFLYLIIENDDVDSLQKYLSNSNIDINENYQGVKLIEYSAFLSSIKCFKYLLNNHARIEHQIGQFAVAGGNSEIIHICDQKGIIFENTLEIAAAFHHYDIFNWLIETKNQLIDSNTVSQCFLFSNFKILNQIYDDMKLSLNDLLIYAANNYQLSFFKLISTYPNIDLFHGDNKKYTSLHAACENNDYKLLEFILSNPLSASAELNLRNIENDISPLHLACSNKNNTKILELLLSNPKIDVNSKSFGKSRLTPLHLACKHGNYDAVKLLLKAKNIQINPLTYDHITPFYYACQFGEINIVKLLIENNANTNISNTENGTTPILAAAMNGHFDIVDLLISNENIIDKTKNGANLYLIASKNGNIEDIKKILLFKVDVLYKDNKRLGALHYACKGDDNKEKLEFLISLGCDYKDETKNITYIFLLQITTSLCMQKRKH